MNYEGLWGYNPSAMTCAELKMPMFGIFREGSASPMAHVAAMLERTISAVPDVKVRVRSDSAGFQAKVVRVLREKGADFTITMRKDDNVLESIYGIPEKQWKPYNGGAWENRKCEISAAVVVGNHVHGVDSAAVDGGLKGKTAGNMSRRRRTGQKTPI